MTKPHNYGEVGSPISGSRFVRDYCTSCGSPIRVKTVGDNHCTDCCLTRRTGGATDIASESDRTYHGGRFYAAEW